MIRRASLTSGLDLQLSWPESWPQLSKRSSRRLTSKKLLLLLALLSFLLYGLLLHTVLSNLRIGRGARIIKVVVLTIEDLISRVITTEEGLDGHFLPLSPRVVPEGESENSEYEESRYSNPSGWLIRHGDWVVMNYGPNFSPVRSLDNYEARSKSSSSRQSQPQSVLRDKDAEAGNDSMLPGLLAAERIDILGSSNEDNKKVLCPPLYGDRNKNFDRKSSLLGNENKSPTSEILPTYSLAETCTSESTENCMDPGKDPSRTHPLQVVGTAPSNDKDSGMKTLNFGEESSEETKIDTKSFSGPESPRYHSYNRNHFRRRRASPISVVDLREKAALLKDSKGKTINRRWAEEIKKLDVPSCSLQDISKTGFEDNSFMEDREEDGINCVPLSRTNSTSTDEENFDNRFLVLSPQMLSPNHFPEEPLTDQGRSKILSSPSWQSKESSPSGSPRKRVRFVGGSKDELATSSGKESRASPVETLPLYKLSASEIASNKKDIQTPPDLAHGDMAYENKCVEDVLDQLGQKIPDSLASPLDTPDEESIASSQDFSIFQDDDNSCAEDERSRNPSSIIPMRSKIPVTRRSFKAKYAIKNIPVFSGNQTRPSKPSSPQSSPLRQPPLTVRSLNQQSSQAAETESIRGNKLSHEEWPGLPSQRAQSAESTKAVHSNASKDKCPQPIFVVPGVSRRDPELGCERQENISTGPQLRPPKLGRFELYQTFFGDDVDDNPDAVFD